MTPEQRLNRLERVAKLFVAAGLRAREQSREQNEKINILISMHEMNKDQWRAESDALNEKINILINTQIAASEQITQAGEQVTQAGEQIKTLAVGQAELAESQKLTDKTLRAFIDSLRKGGNGKSSN